MTEGIEGQMQFPETPMEIIRPALPEGGYKGIFMTTSSQDKDGNAIYVYEDDPEKSDYPTRTFALNGSAAIMIIVHEDVTREMLWKSKGKRGFDARIVKITDKKDAPILGSDVFVYKKDISRKTQKQRKAIVDEKEAGLPSWATDDNIPF
ncbi:MAG TPA: hypothetical protein VFD45_00025 [Patescibacteria group bacterium]|nr:hypothetical protein [Patescibacteria group bacterium]